ncbi:hypothetical protein JB92DRAFT_220438 [Gautieria morchelliformis]|nr:hypothetical protein JB92DRAFT_220438 [Gautieria morchelliformis]
METNWCFTCGRQTCDDDKIYCSNTCMIMDRRSMISSLPPNTLIYLPSFEVPEVSPRRRTPRTKPLACIETRSRTSDGFSHWAPYNVARFRDEELQEAGPSSIVGSRWTGSDRQGIRVWARAVCAGLDEDSVSPVIEHSSTDDRLHTRPPFPVTAPNLVPPSVTVVPRHALLLHTSTLPSYPEDPRAPSRPDGASLATQSVITFSRSRKTASPKAKARLGSLMLKMCSWIVSPPRDPPTSQERNTPAAIRR